MANGRIANKSSRRNSHSVKALSKEFAASTSMHGIKFIAQDDASWPERILWIVLFCFGFFFASFFSWNLWNNWENAPVLITIQTANFPITSYPFPTVTICSVNKVSTKALGLWMSTPEAKYFQLNEIRRILEILSTNRVKEGDDIQALNDLLTKANISSNDRGYEKLINSISPTCSSMAVHCTWEEKEEDCGQLFETEATDDGFCCSFNSIILSKNRTLSPNNLRYAKTNGVYAGLSVILDAQIEDYNVTSALFTGFKVSIQAPDDFAQTGRVGFMTSPGHQIEASVSGQAQVSNDRVRSISLEKRLCTTDTEIKLKYFIENYTQSYCQMDCLTSFFLAECSCIPYYFPVVVDLPVCNLSSYLCLDRVKDFAIRNSSACHCPDACDNVWYQTVISSGNGPNPTAEYPPVILERISKFENISKNDFNVYAKTNIVKLNVYFKSATGLSYIIDQRTTWADFISATGGLFGLGFGFSILSAAELLYFLLIRWIYYWHQSRKTASRQVNTSQVVTLAYTMPATNKQDRRNRRQLARSYRPIYEAWTVWNDSLVPAAPERNKSNETILYY